MDILAVVTSHKIAPIEVREKLCFSRDETLAALQELKRRGYRECAIISTCNRTEAYVVSPLEDRGAETLRDALIDFKKARTIVRPDHFQSFISTEVAHHLFEVAAGIDSMVVGDVQILGQVKEAFNLSKNVGTSGLFTNRLFQSALHVGKRCRTETEISEGAVSISYAAVELASKIFAHLDRKTALLIGAGKTGELTPKHLVSKGVKDVIFANRTRAKAEDLVRKLGGCIADFQDLHAQLRRADIVISSVSSPNYMLTAQDIQRSMKGRDNTPLLIVDIGVPRNVDPRVNRISNVFLHDIDALQRLVDQNLEKRMREASKARRIVEEELVGFTHWYNSLNVNPTIQQLTELFEQIRRAEIDKQTHRFTEHDRELMNIVTKRILNKILHIPIMRLKNAENESSEETLTKIDTIRDLFGLAEKQRDA